MLMLDLFRLLAPIIYYVKMLRKEKLYVLLVLSCVLTVNDEEAVLLIDDAANPVTSPAFDSAPFFSPREMKN